MNNPFENFDDWDEDIPENTTVNLQFQQSSRLGPRLNTTDNQLRQIGHKLGKEYSAQYIYNRIQRYRQQVAINSDRVENMLAEGRHEDAEYFLQATFDYQAKLHKWQEIARNRRETNITGVTRINIHRS